MRWSARSLVLSRLVTAAAFTLVLGLLVPAEPVDAAVVQVPVRDAAGARLATITYDDEKAVRLGHERGFLFTIDPVDPSRNASARIDVVPLNRTALTVTHVPPRTSLGDGAVTLSARIAADADAEPRRYPVTVHVIVLNPAATNASTMLTRADLPMNVTVSRLPTPLGETGSTLSMGEWVTFGGLTLAVVGAVALTGVRRRRRADARRGDGADRREGRA